ncbi:MAG TPA: NAD(P)-dependent oxidoreductase [Acidimicrobiia bacterium]
MRTWIIGSGGLFGSALVRASANPFVGSAIPWSNPGSALDALRRSLEDFVATTSGEWCIIWAAGHATTSSSQLEADRELDLFRTFIQLLEGQRPLGRGVFVFTSSAGGVYAGSASPPFTSDTSPAPLGTYGKLKLEQERSASALTDHLPVVTLRLSNLYGPGQDLGKLQGVISRLALAAITREPITMFVPLDTMRDYIFTNDAAQRALHWASECLEAQQSATRIVASGQPETLGHIIALMNDITRVRIPIASGVHASAQAQARDLRLTPDTDPVIQRLPMTSLPAGMKQVFLDIRQRHASASLSAALP